MTHSHGREVRDDLAPLGRELRAAIPEVYRAFADVGRSAMAAGSLDRKTKELIALGIAISKECDGCIASHAHGAITNGATLPEVAEMIGVTILMNGGPAQVYGPRAYAAATEFLAANRK